MQKSRPQQNLREVVRRAFEDIEEGGAESAASRAGGEFAGRVVEIDLLGRRLTVDLAAREVRDGRGVRVDDYTAAVVVRYLALASKLPGEPGPDVSFADDTDARGYLGPFRGRVLAPLLARFGTDRDGFTRAARALGAERLEDLEGLGAAAFRIRVFPKVALAFILHPGDDEFPPEGQVLFPRTLLRALPVEDAVSMADLVSRALRGKL